METSGIFEDNDRSKRLMAIVNYNTDVSQYWEWSGQGLHRSAARLARSMLGSE